MRSPFLAVCLLLILLVDICTAQNVLQVFSLAGHGGSSVANYLANEWGMQGGFEEHDRAVSDSTDSLQWVTDGTNTIVNMKGFGGPDGPNSDEASINAIVMHAKKAGHINGWLLVVNGEDLTASSLTELLMMYLETFGPEMAQQLGVVITRSYLIPDDQVAAFRQELDAILSTLTGRPVKDTPVWLVETNMDRLKARGIPDSVVQEAKSRLKVVAREIKQWLTRQAPRDVTTVVPAPHPRSRKEVVAEEKLRLAIDNFNKESLKAEQHAGEDLLCTAEAIRVFAGESAKNSQEKAQFIDAHSGDWLLSWHELFAILKTVTFSLPLVAANANKSIDNHLDVAKSAMYYALVRRV